MPAFIKTPKDEDLWSKAKAQAEKAGHKEDWAYITGIYKKMHGGKVAIQRVAARYAAQSAADQFARNTSDCLRLLHAIETDIKKTQRDFSSTFKTDWGYAGSMWHARQLLTEVHLFLSGTMA